MELELKVTSVFDKNLAEYKKGVRFLINQGGSRSSKTFSILQLLIFICLTEPGKKVSIVRKSFPSLRGSILKDFMEIMEELSLYNPKNHNKTENTYKFSNGSIIEFFSIDDAKKVRGRKRDIAYINEANELVFDEFQQLSLRTSQTLFIDFNPSDSEHFLYDLIRDKRSFLIKSTYKDNIFLHPDLVQEIENLINVDDNYYRIYALGEKPSKTARIYTHFKQYDILPEDIKDSCWGLDFGYIHNTALVKCYFKDNRVYIRQFLYENGLTISELISRCKEIITDGKIVYCDSARPDVIEELKRNKINARSSDKQVKEGIDYMRSKEIYIHNESTDLWNEYKRYSYKTIGNNITEEPIKVLDDCFVGDTLITTINGDVKIKDININDLVLTSNGYKRVLLTHHIEPKLVKKYRIETDTFNIYLNCTSDHKIKTTKGWISISQLKSGMMVFLTKNLMEKNINYIQVEDILHNTDGQCIERCGNTSMDQYQRDMISTIKMKIPGIIGSRILNVLKDLNTKVNILKKELKRIRIGSSNFKKEELNVQKIGIAQKKVGNGIDNTRKNSILDILPMEKECVNSVEISLSKEQNNNCSVLKENHIIIAEVLFVEEELEERKEKVYDLTVEDDHEYFANGLLVHNCLDASRYGVYTHRNKIDIKKVRFY